MDSRNNRKILWLVIKKKLPLPLLFSVSIGLLLFALPKFCSAWKNLISDGQFYFLFSNIFIQIIIGIAALVGAVVVSDFIRTEPNKKAYWEFRSDFVELVFLILFVLVCSLFVPFIPLIPKYQTGISAVAIFTLVILSLFILQDAAILIRRIIGHKLYDRDGSRKSRKES